MDPIRDDDNNLQDDYDDFGEAARVLADPMRHPVHAAVYDNNLAGLQTCLAAGHDVDIRNNESGKTSLMVAVIHNKREAARILLQGGADPLLMHAGGNDDYTPLDIAASRGHDEMACLLWTVLPPETQHRQSGFLVKAATHGRTSLIQFLLDTSSEVWDAVVLERALLIAARKWHLHAATLLLDRKTYTPNSLQAALFAAVDTKIMLAHDYRGPIYEAVDYT
ncbi:ankyrin repeat domain-containing protein, partial [Candidatus Bathyarchaeota archaeon]|nr:ankyrin repeat domain-containing protein [Candidatus Bathyarchaeota archaeon]